MSRIDRLLMTADAVGGVWTFTTDLAQALARHGVEVAVAVLGPAPSERQRAALEAAGIDCVHCDCRLEWMDDAWDDVAAAGEWLLRVADAVAPDVVHLNGYCHAGLPWQAPILVTGHSCVLSWWRAVHGQEAPASWDEYAKRVNEGLRAANLVTAPTAAMLDQLDRYYGPFTSTRVIANGRALPAPAEAPKQPFVLTAGRLWDKAKNVSAVCRVAPRLRWPVRVAGDTRAPDGSEVHCDAVEYLGRLDHGVLAAWMARASIYVLPARYEPFGLSALEAALAGCALVLGDIDSLREVWHDAALYVPPDDEQVLVNAIALLIENEPLRAGMGERARMRASKFTVDRMADAYLDAYASIASRQRRVSPVTC